MTYRKCSDIPDVVFLDAVDTARRGPGVTWAWADRWDTAAVLAGRLDLVNYTADDPGALVPGRLVRAKARKLIDRRLMNGCTCGCRGDFELTPAGTHKLMEHRMTAKRDQFDRGEQGQQEGGT